MRPFIITNHFKKQAKHYQKKYRQLLPDVVWALENFDEPLAVSLGANVYKLRLRVSGLARGKSGSFRLLVLVVMPKKFIVPLTLYFKGDQNNITYQEIKRHLEAIEQELRL
ncbi:MAG: type II toxin-antitoxin system RelE/ParE family toxin [Candidatus Magasanikbacteria bacterium]|nr:type II toxin-antitoxin system RelE/ParE family toxin [Candidatus Magasanikbacteria bacterium]